MTSGRFTVVAIPRQSNNNTKNFHLCGNERLHRFQCKYKFAVPTVFFGHLSIIPSRASIITRIVVRGSCRPPVLLPHKHYQTRATDLDFMEDGLLPESTGQIDCISGAMATA